MKSIIAVSVLFFAPFLAFSQLDPIGQFNRYVIESWAGEYHRVGQYRVRGSNMLFGQPLTGTLKCQNMDPVACPRLLYDLSLQVVGPEADGKVMVPTNTVESFEAEFPAQFGGGKVLFRSSSNYLSSQDKQFYQVLAEGPKAHLLKAYKVKVVPDPSNLMDKELRIFEQYAEYYLFMPASRELRKIKLQKKSVMEALGSVAGADSYAGQLNVNFAREEDVVKLIQAVNQ